MFTIFLSRSVLVWRISLRDEKKILFLVTIYVGRTILKKMNNKNDIKAKVLLDVRSEYRRHVRRRTYYG